MNSSAISKRRAVPPSNFHHCTVDWRSLCQNLDKRLIPTGLQLGSVWLQWHDGRHSLRSLRPVSASVPQPNAKHNPGCACCFPHVTTECGGLAEYTGVRVPDVGSELARKLISDSHAAVEAREATSDPACRVCLTVEIHFDLRLQYQALTEIQIVRALDSSRDASSIANIKRGCKIEEVRSKSLHAECGPRPSWTGIEIETHTRLPIEVTHVRNRPVVENFVVSVAADAVCDHSFRLDPQFVQVGSNPALAVPFETIVRPVRSAFQLVERYIVKYSVIFHWLGPIRCRSWCVNRSRRGLCRNRYCSEARQQSSREDKLESAARHHDTTTVRNIPASMW